MSGKQEATKLTPEDEAEMEKDLKEFKEEVASLYASDEYFKLCIDSLGMWCQTYDSLCKLTDDDDKLEMILEGYSSITLGISQIIQERYGFHVLDTDYLLTEMEEGRFWGCSFQRQSQHIRNILKPTCLEIARHLLIES